MSAAKARYVHPVAVLGAGVTGSCVALDLARRGSGVALLEQDERPVNRAGLRNEGKIHLGLCYANDTTLQTASIQLRGALSFRRLLEDCIGEKANQLVLSTPFVYAVAADSILSADALSVIYPRINELYLDLLESEPDLDYMGATPAGLFSRLDTDALTPAYNLRGIAAAFATNEIAIDPAQLAGLVREAIEGQPLITLLAGARVSGVAKENGVYRIDYQRHGLARQLYAAQVVNAAWDGRLAIDRSMHMLSEENWLHRLKYRVIVRLPDRLLNLPSVTMVVGRYGDIVVRPNGTGYLSWYPAGLQGWTHAVSPPASWTAPCRGEADVSQARLIADRIIEGIESWYPGVTDAEILEIDAGAILAVGRTDVDDASSQLHTRTVVGVRSEGGYHSVDPGKLTTAPWFARQVADRVEAWQAKARGSVGIHV